MTRPRHGGRVMEASFLAALLLFALFVGGLILVDFLYIEPAAFGWILREPGVRHALWMSAWTSVTATLVSLLFAVPSGYALSRLRFPGRSLCDALVDLPIVFPPLVAGLTLLVFFAQNPVGRAIEATGWGFIFHPRGIVLCQFFVAASFSIRAAKVAFDEVDPRLEGVALTLGCSPWRAFSRVSLPLAKNGILAGTVLTWARAFGLFGPLLVFVGSVRGKTEVLSTTIYLEQSVGNLDRSLAAALVLVVVALGALLAIRRLGGSSDRFGGLT